MGKETVLGIVMRATYDILLVGTERQAMLRMLSAQSESNGSFPLLLPLCKSSGTSLAMAHALNHVLCMEPMHIQ